MIFNELRRNHQVARGDLTTYFDYQVTNPLHLSTIKGMISTMKGDWESVAENLVKHTNGTYYVRAKVDGKQIRLSLKTKNLRVAKVKREAELTKARESARAAGDGMRTIGDALQALEHDLTSRPNIKDRTKAAIRESMKILRATLQVQTPGAEWTRREAGAWWTKVGLKYSSSVANKLHGLVRGMVRILVESGARTDDPTKDLGRMRQPKSKLTVPGIDQMRQMVASIAGAGKRGCVQSSRMVAFMAYSGVRKGEVGKLTWNDIGEQWVTVGADGNTKGGSFRQVPVSAPLREVLEGMRADNDKGRIFHMTSPRRALHSACEAVGVAPMRVHDLRHFYATFCIERGVDIPTVAKWLGHKDGGALAMRTYGHVRDDHSLEAVKLLG